MRLIIAGSREYPQAVMQKQLLESWQWISTATEVISGCARGPDTWGATYARANGIPVREFPANWKPDGVNVDRGAGHKRNQEMLDCGTALLAFWDGKSKGTEHMIRIAGQKGIPVFVCKPPIGAPAHGT